MSFPGVHHHRTVEPEAAQVTDAGHSHCFKFMQFSASMGNKPPSESSWVQEGLTPELWLWGSTIWQQLLGEMSISGGKRLLSYNNICAFSIWMGSFMDRQTFGQPYANDRVTTWVTPFTPCSSQQLKTDHRKCSKEKHVLTCGSAPYTKRWSYTQKLEASRSK